MNTCFAILLGDISVNDDLNQLQGLQGVAATLFFWSFELLVFMVLLNFLLAIIVDAFSEVKENTHETTGIPKPLPSNVPRMASSCRSVSRLLTFPQKSSSGDVKISSTALCLLVLHSWPAMSTTKASKSQVRRPIT